MGGPRSEGTGVDNIPQISRHPSISGRHKNIHKRHKTCLSNKNNPIRMLKLFSCVYKHVHISACLKTV